MSEDCHRDILPILPPWTKDIQESLWLVELWNLSSSDTCGYELHTLKEPKSMTPFSMSMQWDISGGQEVEAGSHAVLFFIATNLFKKIPNKTHC